MHIHGIDKLTWIEIMGELEAGGRFVYYEYCVSLLVVSTRRPSAIYFLRANDWGILRGLPYCLISLVLGWWGIPWGVIYTPLTLLNNLSGGCDISAWVLARLEHEMESEARTLPCEPA